eukprot:tig00021726_g23267.t1
MAVTINVSDALRREADRVASSFVLVKDSDDEYSSGEEAKMTGEGIRYWATETVRRTMRDLKEKKTREEAHREAFDHIAGSIILIEDSDEEESDYNRKAKLTHSGINYWVNRQVEKRMHEFRQKRSQIAAARALQIMSAPAPAPAVAPVAPEPFAASDDMEESENSEAESEDM